MKPIKLTIQAFGPFVGKEEINFSKLGDNPLFLINGPTGSGKSTILDAICFALYGQTTGAERDASQMRCDQADRETLTEVTLDFSLGEKIYRIRRSPNQKRAKKHGDGLTEHTGTAELNEINAAGESRLIVARKLKQATDKIEELTGLNVEQFRQVMVLPQGKFRELLLASSADRQKIFAQLFKTNIYKRIEDELFAKSKSIRENVKAHQNKIRGILEGADLHTEEAVQVDIEEIKPLSDKAKIHKAAIDTAYQEAINQKKIAEILIHNFSELEKTKLLIEEKSKQKPEIQRKQSEFERAQQASKIKPVYDNLVRITNEIEQLNTDVTDTSEEINRIKIELNKSEDELNVSKEDAKAIDRVKQRINELQRFDKKVSELEDTRAVVQKSKQVCALSSRAIADAQTEYDMRVKDKTAQEIRVSLIQKDLSELGSKQVNLQKLAIQMKQRQKLDVNRATYNELNTRGNTTRESFEKRSEIFEASTQFAKKQELYWHAGQAAILAEELHDGIPCPVCGSEEHPSPAKLDGTKTVVSKEQVEKSRVQVDKDRANMQSAKDSVTEIISQIELISNTVEELEKDLGSVASESLVNIEAVYKVVESEVIVLDKLKQELTTIDSDLVKCNLDIDKSLKAVDQFKEKAESDKIQYTQDQSAVIHIEKELPEEFRNKVALLTAIQTLEKKVQSLVDALNKTQKHFDKCKENVTRQTTHLQGLEEREKLLTKQRIKEKENWSKSLDSSSFQTEQQYLQSILDDAQVTDLNNEISSYDEELNKIKGALKQQEDALKGKTKPELNSLIKLCDEKYEELKEADIGWNKLHSRMTQLNDVQKKLKKAHEENKKLEAEYAIYGTLSNVANGQTGNKISLQRFVLGVLLDDVLIDASDKLYNMTNGRYILLRKQDKSKGGGASGLELDVEDSYTGKTRSVATLSGGESFMAALALALGLSDVVQAYAGGIKLDALFIDEGFGSLDQESLDLAIRTLIDLQETGRMIGVISHVSELKEQMTLRLDVVSSKAGSTIKTFTV